ncbi:Gfo/Idh/MocA family oxidoreductase [Phyllobacterium sp. YR531]|uniref:Gfo/Idh/MocA family protein n=1 Tax=Phyllobacterium sp. YR531 TaxID=1144343 RepID=UPI00026F52C3|nr:Gfo/Idh/MocA family oxidoreductase [Phyllobacterium sp. YR531]EJM99976.1 putative dehydrogenase [Phyllobacterium sp. YR531]
MKKLGLAIIGLGPAVLPHARSLVDLKDKVDVIWAASRTKERAAEFAQAFPFPVTSNINAAISDPAVDIVLVLTPANAHLEIAEKSFAAGKHVLLEKPLDITLQRAERIVSSGRASGLTFGVVLQHRFRAASLRLRKALEDNSLGDIQAASLRVPWWRPQSYYDESGRGTFARDGGGVLLSQAIHSLDLFRSLLPVRNVVASQVRTTSLHRMESEDHVTALMTLASGAPASLLATTAAFPGFPETLEITGSSGSAHLSGGALKLSWLDGREEVVEAEGKTGSGANIMDFPHDAHRALIADFLAAVAEKRDPVVTGEEALATQRLIADIIRADPANTQPV